MESAIQSEETAHVTEVGLDRIARKNALKVDTEETAFISANVRMELSVSRRRDSVSAHQVIKADIAKSLVLLVILG